LYLQVVIINKKSLPFWYTLCFKEIHLLASRTRQPREVDFGTYAPWVGYAPAQEKVLPLVTGLAEDGDQGVWAGKTQAIQA
jgi:hypothetical protein